MDANREHKGAAIIGCGYWGINYVRVLDELPDVNVVSVCDQRQKRLDEVNRRFPNVSLATDLNTALASEGVDFAVVCSTATSHYEIARRCLEAGKHVLIEKPITTRSEDAKNLIALAQARGLTIMVGHTFLYNAAVQKVKHYIDREKTGQIYYIYAQRTNLGPIRQDVNAIWDLAPHDVSIFNYLLDEAPVWASAVGGKVLQPWYEDFGFISLGYASGVVGHIHVSWADPNKVREVVVVGSEGRIVFDDVNTREQVRFFEKGVTPTPAEAPSYGEFRFTVRDGDIISPKIEVSEPLKTQCRHFIRCLTENKRPISDGEAGLDVVQVMEAINRSIEMNGAPVRIQPVEEDGLREQPKSPRGAPPTRAPELTTRQKPS